MEVGDVVTTRDIKVMIQDGFGYLHYKAPKGRRFVFLLLGDEGDKGKGEALDPVAALRALGWKMKG